MKKTLKLLFALSTTTTLSLSVIACKQQDLDNTLKIIQNGVTNYDINKVSDKTINPKALSTITLTTEESQELAQSIAQKILDDNKSGINISWFSADTPVNQQCYNFEITNGKKENTNLTWNVLIDNQRFQLDISYLVGTVNQDKSFGAKQRIKMTFYIKVGTSQSDNQLTEWKTNFDNQGWNSDTPLEVDLTSKKITIPINWSNASKNAVSATYETIKEQLTWPGALNPSIQIQNINDTVNNGLLKLQLIVNLGDSKANTNDFYIKFV